MGVDQHIDTPLVALELASQIEMQLVQLYKAGQIKDKIDDDQLKELLKKLQESGKEREIKY
ncbi:MAG: DNA-binding protein [Bradymonadaceae bacterium]